MNDTFGSGIHLDSQFDFSVDPSGDLQAERGLDELQKDLAFQMVINLNKFLGKPPSGNLEARVATTAERVAEVDSRIDFVRTELTEVSYSNDRQEITVKITADTETGEQELVFDV